MVEMSKTVKNFLNMLYNFEFKISGKIKNAHESLYE